MLEAPLSSMEEMEHLNTLLRVLEALVVAELDMETAGLVAPVVEDTLAVVPVVEPEVAVEDRTTPVATRTTRLVFSPTMDS